MMQSGSENTDVGAAGPRSPRTHALHFTCRSPWGVCPPVEPPWATVSSLLPGVAG